MGQSYARALEQVLHPLGFGRAGDDWVRVRGEAWECVNRQSGQFGVTINLCAKNLGTEELFLKIFGSVGATQMPPTILRIGALIDGRDDWWRSDKPNGPSELASAVLRYGLPWFEKALTLEQQAEHWYARASVLSQRGYSGISLVGLALTLCRMGELDEACEVLRKPVPRTAIASSVRDVLQVREWLGCDARAM